MLIELDDQALPNLADFREADWNSINNLAQAGREGLHFVLASQTLARALSQNSNLASREQAFFRVIAERFPTLYSIKSRVETQIRVFPNVSPRIIGTGNLKEIHLPLSHFNSSEATRESILLSENLDDCEFIFEIARFYAKHLHIHSVATRLELQGGGGSQVARAADHILTNTPRLLVISVDSDKDSPAANLGSTASASKKIFEKHSSLISELVVINARDLENLIPDSVLVSCGEYFPEHQDTFQLIANLSGENCGQARLYIDIEKGLCLKELFRLRGKSQECHSVWDPVFCSIAKNIPSSTRSACVESENCNTRRSCQCCITKPNGGSILALATTEIKRHGSQMWASIPQILRDEIERLGRIAFDWGCAQKPQSS